MKKFIAMLLVLMLCLGLCACAAAEPEQTAATTQAAGESLEASTQTETTGEVSTGDSALSPEETDEAETAGQTNETQLTEQPVETEEPTETPTEEPTEEPTQAPTEEPTQAPTTAPAVDGKTYAKVDGSAVTAGFYLLYGSSAYSVDDGSTDSFLSGSFDSKNRLTCADLSISGDSVTTEDKHMIWQLIDANGGFYVKNAGTGKYLVYGDSTGNAIFDTASQSQAGVWKVVSHDDVWTLEEVASGRQLSVNAFGSEGSKYLGAAAYSSTGSTARSLTFYRLTGGTVTPNEPAAEPTQAPTQTATQTTATQAATEQTTETQANISSSETDGEITYVLNTNSKKYHNPDCGSVSKMSEKNKEETTLSKEELEAMGYTACGSCKP